ncbi:MAG: hypothetical protein RIS35_3243, partial [Pseudomonadota bacterium]
MPRPSLATSRPRTDRPASRRRLIGATALAIGAASLLMAGRATAQEWPTKPIRIVVGFPAGSTTDLMARAIAEHMRG